MKNNRIIFRVTWSYMKKNVRRTITTMLGILAMVAMMTCVFVGKDTAFDYMMRVAAAKEGTWHYTLHDASVEEYEAIQQNEYITQTEISYTEGHIVYEDSPNILKPYILVKAYSTGNYELRNVRISEGRLPENDDEIVVSKSILDDGGSIAIGDQISADFVERKIKGIDPESKETVFPYYNVTVHYGEEIDVPQSFPYFAEADKSFEEFVVSTGESRTYTVVGIVEVPSFESKDGAFYGAYTTVPNEVVAEKPSQITMCCNLKKVDKVWDFLREITGDAYERFDSNDIVLIFAAASSYSDLNKVADFMAAFFLIFIMIISVVLIYNVFNISYEERSKYLGMLSSVGATKTQKSMSIYFEAFVLLIVAMPLGILTGFGVVLGGMAVLKPYLINLESIFMRIADVDTAIRLDISWMNILWIVLISIITVLIAAYLPARKIAKIGAIESIRGNESSKRLKKVSNTGSKKLLKNKPERLLAKRQITKHKKKARSIVSSITAFLLVFIVISFGVVNIVKRVQGVLIEDSSININCYDYDASVTEFGGDANQFQNVKELIEADSHATYSTWYETVYFASFDGELMNAKYWDALRNIAEAYLGELEDEEFEEYRELGMVNLLAMEDDIFYELARSCNADMDALNQAEYPIILYESVDLSTKNIRFGANGTSKYLIYELDDITDLQAGDTMPLKVYNYQKECQEELGGSVIATVTRDEIKDYVDISGENIWILTSASTAKRYNDNFGLIDESGYREGLFENVLVQYNCENGDLQRYLEELETDDNANVYVSASNREEIVLTFYDAICSIIRIMGIGFIILTALLCLVNLYNSIRARAVSRKRELAMLRSIGMETRQMNKMLFYENLGITAKGLLWSVVCSMPIIIILCKVFDEFFGKVRMTIPWIPYICAVVIVIFVVTILTGICYNDKGNSNILEEVRKENI